MKHARFELTSEQTLRLEELRDALAKTLPAGAAETVAFPVSQFGGCGAVCMPGCTGSCVAGCASSCTGSCTDNCYGSCEGLCHAMCTGDCGINCYGLVN
jgi:hypothetical protein